MLGYGGGYQAGGKTARGGGGAPRGGGFRGGRGGQQRGGPRTRPY